MTSAPARTAASELIHTQTPIIVAVPADHDVFARPGLTTLSITNFTENSRLQVCMANSVRQHDMPGAAIDCSRIRAPDGFRKGTRRASVTYMTGTPRLMHESQLLLSPQQVIHGPIFSNVLTDHAGSQECGPHQ